MYAKSENKWKKKYQKKRASLKYYNSINYLLYLIKNIYYEVDRFIADFSLVIKKRAKNRGRNGKLYTNTERARQCSENLPTKLLARQVTGHQPAVRIFFFPRVNFAARERRNEPGYIPIPDVNNAFQPTGPRFSG